MKRRDLLRMIGIGGLAAGAAKVLPTKESPVKAAKEDVIPDPVPAMPWIPYQHSDRSAGQHTQQRATVHARHQSPRLTLNSGPLDEEVVA